MTAFRSKDNGRFDACDIIAVTNIIVIQCQNLIDNEINSIIKVALVFLLLLFVLLRNGLKIPYSRAGGWCLLLLLCTSSSLIYTVDLSTSLDVYFKVALTYISGWVFSQYIRDDREIDILINSLILGAFIYVLFIVMLQGIQNLMVSGISERYTNGTIMQLTTVTIPAIMLITWKLFQKKEHRGFYVILWLVMYAFNLLSERRKATLIPIIFMIMMLFLKRDKTMTVKSLIKKYSMLIIFGTIGALFLYVSISNEILYNVYGYRVWNLFARLMGEGIIDKSLDTREMARSIGIEYFLAHPFIGVGIGNFPKIYSNIAHAHNNYIELLCTIGLHGFLLFYYSYYIIIKGTVKELSPSKALLFFAIICTLLIMDYSTTTYTGFGYIIFVVMGMWYVQSRRRGGREIEKNRAMPII